MNKLRDFILLSGCYFLYNYCDRIDEFHKNHNCEKNTVKNLTSENLNYLKKIHLQQIFKSEKFILNNHLKSKQNVSIPFNRKIKYIYNLPFFYLEYENYNFNKLSDLFLNIHIFIN